MSHYHCLDFVHPGCLVLMTSFLEDKLLKNMSQLESVNNATELERINPGFNTDRKGWFTLNISVQLLIFTAGTRCWLQKDEARSQKEANYYIPARTTAPICKAVIIVWWCDNFLLLITDELLNSDGRLSECFCVKWISEKFTERTCFVHLLNRKSKKCYFFLQKSSGT